METLNNKENSPKAKGPKINWLAAVGWTTVVSCISTLIFIIGATYYIESTGFLNGLDSRNKQIVTLLQTQIQNQSESIKALTAENREIMGYLKLWTPLQCSPRKSEKWKIIGYGLPKLEKHANELMSIER